MYISSNVDDSLSIEIKRYTRGCGCGSRYGVRGDQTANSAVDLENHGKLQLVILTITQPWQSRAAICAGHCTRWQGQCLRNVNVCNRGGPRPLKRRGRSRHATPGGRTIEKTTSRLHQIQTHKLHQKPLLPSSQPMQQQQHPQSR